MGRYAIFNGLVYGGGTDVIPNPEGAPTDELHSLQIGNDIYEIVGGGGSGGGNATLDATTLYDTPITATGTYTLADDYNNYDFIGFKAGNGSTETDIRLYAVKDIQDSMNDNLVITNNVTNSWFNFTINENELTIPGKTVSTIYSVIGYKIKGGGGSSTNVQRLSPEAYNALPQSEKENGTIYFVHQDAGETTISGTFTTGSTQYEKVIVNCGFKPTSISVILPFSNGNTYAEYDEAISTTTSTWEIPMESRTYTITLGSETGESGITDILDNGFKFRCNASNTRNVNCTFEATGVLDNEINKIYYMGDEYTNDGSSGDGSQELISYDTTITTTQYGWWAVEDKDGNTLDPDQYELIAVTPIVNNSSSWTGAWDGAFFIETVDGTTYYYDVTFVNINDGGYIRSSRTWDVKVVYRDKNAAGGGGGSTVVPNPQEEPTDTLNTIEIDGVVYDIEGGSEGGQGLNPANYSTEEEVIGVWTNNLPVYKKTWTFSSAITIGSNSWADTSISVNDTQIHTIVNCEAVGPNGQAWTCISATTDEATQTYVRILNTRDTNVAVKHLTLYYIKDGDSPIVPPGAKGEYNYYGGFIDTSNVIQNRIIFHSETSYTATENCAVIWSVANDTSTSMNVLIDGVLVAGMYADTVAQPTNFIFLKKNQTITFRPSYSSGDSSYAVYGIMYDNEKYIEGEGVEIYSENEYIVGKWIDGKKLYQKTYHLAQAITVAGGGTWIDTGINISDIETLVDSKFSQNIAVWDAINGINDNGTLKATILASGSLTIDTITLRYTKTVETPAPAWGGSVNNYYANFIDTDNVIDSGSYQGSFTYTATEDCFINIAVVMSANDSATITIDGSLVTSGWCASLNTINPILPLKKGQTLIATASASNTSSYTVYGITYASGGSSSGSSVEYSTEEKEVGTWIDGSKIYQKTIHITESSEQTLGQYIINELIGASFFNIINSMLKFGAEGGNNWNTPYFVNDQYNSDVNVTNTSANNLTIISNGWKYTEAYITIQYTKTVS